jgi:transcriptional regulator with XRE-family HTH domain
MRQCLDIDNYIAENLKRARVALGITLQDAAKHHGISYQQLQKYENGINRISAGRLWHLSIIYSRPIEWFFNDNR